MSLTRQQALDEMLTIFKTAWDAVEDPTLVKYENVSNDAVPPSGQESWARVVVRHSTSRVASIGGVIGQRRFRRTGVLTVQIMEHLGQGLTGSSDLPKVIQEAFEGTTSPGGVIFREVSINEVGKDKSNFQTNVVSFFEYDEIR